MLSHKIVVNKSVYWVVFSVFYLVACTCFTFERTLFLDNAFQIFRLIQDESIVVNAYRWPAAIYRILPLLGFWFSLDLKMLLWLFSISYALIPISGVWYLGKYLNDYRAAFLLIFLSCIPLVHGFFWCNSELFLAIQTGVLMWATLDNNKTITSKIFAVCLAWMHPLAFIPALYPYFLKLIHSRKISKHIHSAILIFLINFLVKSLFFKNWYDNLKQAELLQNIKQIDSNISANAMSYLASVDILLIILVLCGSLYLIYNRSILNMLSCLSWTFALGLLFSLSAGNNYSADFYTEVNNYCIYFLVTYVVYLELKKPINSTLLLPVLFTGILLISSLRWQSASDYYRERISWFRSTIVENDRHIIYGNANNNTLLGLAWATAYESLLISSMDGISKSFIYTLDKDKLQLEGRSDVLITEYKLYLLEDLNKQYFNLQDKEYKTRYLD